MLESFYVQSSTITRLKTGPAGKVMEPLAVALTKRGYTKEAARRILRNTDTFSRWLDSHGVSISEAHEDYIASFIAEIGRRPSGKLPKAALGLGMVVRLLDHEGLIEFRAPLPPSESERWLRMFDLHLDQVAGVSENTRRLYLYHARRLMEFLFGKEQSPDWSALTAETLASFVQTEAMQVKRTTIRCKVTAVRVLLRFLIFKGEIQPGLVAAIPPVKTWALDSLPKYVSSNDVQRMLDLCEDGTSAGQRDRAVLLLLSRLGLRVGEVARLRLENIDWQEGQILVRAGKINRERILPLLQDVGDAIANYLKYARPNTTHRTLFLRTQAPLDPLTRGGVTMLASRRMRQVGIIGIRMGAHALRHTVATEMVRGGAKFKDVADVLGHQRLLTTNIYAKLDLDSLSRVAMPWPGGVR